MTSQLRKMKLSDLIEQRKEKYDGKENLPICGVTREGFIPPKQKDADTSIYNVFYKNDFVFNPARMELNSISLNKYIDKGICSSLYEIFYVKRTDIILPEYLNMFIKRSEFARKCWFNAVGSARNYFRIPDLGEFELEIPSIEIQKKYIAIYESLLTNLHCFESDLDDFYNATEIFLMKLKEKYKPEPIGLYIFEKNDRNKKLEVNNVEGVKKDKTFIPTIANMSGIELSNYKIVRQGDFAYSNRINIGSIALKRKGACVVSPSYTVFGVKEGLMPEYLLMWFCRENFLHYAFYYSIGTVKDELDFSELSNMPIPIPPIELQKEAVKLSSIYFDRLNKVEIIKKMLDNICPVLVRGSILEAKGEENNAN